jgi:hypothetical protein
MLRRPEAPDALPLTAYIAGCVREGKEEFRGRMRWLDCDNPRDAALWSTQHYGTQPVDYT